MAPPTFEDIIRRVVGGAVDAGVSSASRSAGDRAKARNEQVEYAAAVLRGHIQSEVARQVQEQAACAAG
jgi:hypothetical protein